MHEIYELKEQLMKELEEYGKKGEMSTGSLEVVDKLAHTIKNLCKIIETAEDEGEYSMADGRSYRDGRMYEGNIMRSYARGRGRNAKRDSMGRYSSAGYSYGNEDMVEQLESLMMDAPENIKSDIKRLISKVESM